MKVKIDDEISEIAYPTFIEWIQSGKITEDSLVSSQAATDGEWMRAGDMRIFGLFSEGGALHQGEDGEIEAIEPPMKPDDGSRLTAKKILEPEEIYFLSFQRRLPRLTLVLVGINVLIFVLQTIAGGSTDPEVLIKFGAYSQPLILYHGEYWRILTHIFLHIGLSHLLVNMGVLFVVGMVLEGLYGKERFLIIYFIAGLMGGIASLLLVREHIGGGASGAIFGLIGTVVVFGIQYRDRIPKRFKRGFGIRILPFLVIDLILGFITPNINIPAHIGGLLGGAVTALILTPRIFHRPEIRERESKQIRITTYAIIAVLLVSMGAAAFDTFDIGRSSEEQIPSDYEKIIELNPKDEGIYEIVYSLYAEAVGKNPEDAGVYYDRLTGLCEKAIDEFPNNNFIWFVRLIYLYEWRINQKPENIEGIYDKLADLYKIVIDKEPDSSKWYNNLAWLYVQRNINSKEAVHLAQKALKLEPDAAYILDTLGWAYLKNGQYKLSLNTFEKVFEIELEMESSWDGVLELAKSKIDREEFMSFYRRMSEKVPENSETHAKLASALQSLRKNED